MKKLTMIASAAVAALALTAPAGAEIPLSSRGTSGTDAKGIGIDVEQGILIVKVSNISGTGDWRDRLLEHNSQGFSLQMEGGVQCKSNHGITRAGLFVGGAEAQVFIPSGMPRERYFTDEYFISPSAFKEGEGTIGFDPIAIVERALDDHMADGGHPVDFLRQDHSFQVWLEPEFRAVCTQKVGGGAATGGLWHDQAVAEGAVKVIVHYNGDKYLASGRARSGTSTSGSNTGNPPARTTTRPERAPIETQSRPLRTSRVETEGQSYDTRDIEAEMNMEAVADAPAEREARSGGLKKTAGSFLGGLLRGKKVKDAAIDATFGEES